MGVHEEALCLCCLLQYLRQLEDGHAAWVYVDVFHFVTHVIRVTLTLVQFVLAFIPDKDKSSVFMMEEVCGCERERLCVCNCVRCVCI